MDIPYEQQLQAFVGRQLMPPTPAQDPVNRPMIRHWVEAMGDSNSVYVDDDIARASGRSGVVAPASMMQAWTMRGYAATVSGNRPGDADRLWAVLDEGGYTSVVATDSDLELHRELVPGDHVSVEEAVEAISEEKETALGRGRFVTTRRTYRDQQGAVVATQGWRVLRFRPGSSEAAKAPASALRPRPALNDDNRFWFEAARRHLLVIQRCVRCGRLRHPPGPACPHCRSLDWEAVEAAGRGNVYSFVVVHHPAHPAFEYPLVVALVELVEGTRLVTNLVGIEPQDVTIGLPVVVDWVDPDPELSLPVFRPGVA